MYIKSLKCNLSFIGVSELRCFCCCLSFIGVGCKKKKNIHIWFPEMSAA